MLNKSPVHFSYSLSHCQCASVKVKFSSRLSTRFEQCKFLTMSPQIFDFFC